jgi:hypothetical protein
MPGLADSRRAKFLVIGNHNLHFVLLAIALSQEYLREASAHSGGDSVRTRLNLRATNIDLILSPLRLPFRHIGGCARSLGASAT